MSLTKKIPTKFRVDADYWKVARREFDDILQTAEVTMFGYPSKNAANNGAEKIEYRRFMLDYNTVKGMNARQMAEHIIATQADFTGGTPD